MKVFSFSWRKLAATMVFLLGPIMDAAAVPGQWGSTDTSQPQSIEWPRTWVGAKNLRAQWFKILAESPDAWKTSGYINHAKGEPPDNTYYLWRYDKPLPEGTKILIEGNFPHARMMSFQVCAPWNNRALVSSDGVGLPEIHMLDEDIVPDPGHVNPFLHGADRTASNRHFHITFELRDGDPVTLNPKAAIPPYRAPGNVRIGCTGSAEPGKLFGSPKVRGPVVYMRMYLPDHYAPFGGVEPPVIRLQLPGKAPELAPISRGMPINLRKFINEYPLADNPAQASGLSVKEEEANRALRDYASRAVAESGQLGTNSAGVHRLFEGADGILRLYKSFQTAWLMTYFKNYLKDPEGCRSKLPRRYRYAFGEMGPDAPPPGNDEHTSDHHAFNTYLVSAANLGPGQLLVFHGKAPQTPHTLNGDAVMGDSSQLRYWNLSMHTGSPTRLTPVVNITDETVAVDRNGYYTIVIGREQDKPAKATAENGMTWRTWPTGSVLSLSWRILSTAVDPWQHAPQRITWQEADTCAFGHNPDAVRARMGDYFPQGRYMSRAQVEKLAAGGTWPSSVAASPEQAMPSAAANAGSRDLILNVDGTVRSYRLHQPASFPTGSKLPLVIALHSGQSSGAEMESMSNLSQLADREHFIAVYPNAIGIYKGKLYWNDGRIPEVDDLRFIGALIDELAAKYGVDTKRVYVTGISNGAGMANRVGIELAGRISAIAPVAGTIGVRAAEKRRPSHPLPVMYFHGSKDPLAYYDGGSAGTFRDSSLSAEDYIRWWAKQDGCKPDSAVQEGMRTKVDDGTSVKRTQYAGCQASSEVVFYRIENGGHTWPGGKPWLPENIVGKTSGNVDASAEMWAFFSRHALP